MKNSEKRSDVLKRGKEWLVIMIILWILVNLVVIIGHNVNISTFLGGEIIYVIMFVLVEICFVIFIFSAPLINVPWISKKVDSSEGLYANHKSLFWFLKFWLIN